MKPKIITDYTTEQFYKNHYLPYIKKRKKEGSYKKERIATLTEYTKIVGKIGQIVIDKILNESLEYRLPYRLGYLSIKKFKQNINLTDKGIIDKKNLHVDWGETWKARFKTYNTNSRKWILENTKVKDRILLYHYNNESGGWVYRFVWNKLTAKVRNYKLYKFLPTRLNKADLTKAIRNPEIKKNYPLYTKVRLD